MDSDEPPISAGVKRPRSPSPSPSSFPSVPPSSTLPSSKDEYEISTPPSKRVRHSQIISASVNEAAGLSSHNPLNRRALKRDAKKARKAARRAGRAKGREGGMEVDDEGEREGLAFTFLAGPDGVVV